MAKKNRKTNMKYGLPEPYNSADRALKHLKNISHIVWDTERNVLVPKEWFCQRHIEGSYSYFAKGFDEEGGIVLDIAGTGERYGIRAIAYAKHGCQKALSEELLCLRVNGYRHVDEKHGQVHDILRGIGRLEGIASAEITPHIRRRQEKWFGAGAYDIRLGSREYKGCISCTIITDEYPNAGPVAVVRPQGICPDKARERIFRFNCSIDDSMKTGTYF